MLNRALDCLQKGLFHQALGHTAAILAVAPRDYFGLVTHATILRRLGRAEEALSFFSAAFSEHPSRIEDLHQFAIALLRTNDLGEAAKHFRQVAKKAREYAQEADHFAGYAAFLADGHKIATVEIEGIALFFHVYPGRQHQGEAVFHANGQLRELDELLFIRDRVPCGGTLVDVGANIGNHLVFLARFLRPRALIPIEPGREAVAQLRQNIAENRITCVDERYLGLGAAKCRGRARLVRSSELVRYALEPAEDGDVSVFPLDEIETPVDFIKIDVEGMEISVLEGARELIGRCRPPMMIEVADRNRGAFEALMRELGYAVERSFRGVGYSNHFVAPQEDSRKIQ